MRSLVLFTIVASAFAVSASAATLDFEGDICGGPCGNGSFVDADYGSISGQLSVSYNRGGFSGVGDPRLSYWDTSYSELIGVAWGGDSVSEGRAEIFFDPAPGFEVTVSQFQLGAWPIFDRTTQVSVLDGLGATLFASAADIVISGAASTTFAGPWTSANGIRIQWGPDAFNVGIDNIVFDVALAGGATPVPLPAPLALLATGLLGLAALRRRA